MKIQKFAITATVMATLLIQACDPVPRRALSVEEKQADMQWIYSQFGEEYAPLEYKESRWGFKFDDLKKAYLDKAAQTKSNEEFYNVMYQFVAEFKDAHTSASLTAATLPGRATVSYLGFSGSRKADQLKVTKLLPTISVDDSHYPIHVGDMIEEIDGVKLKDAIKNELVKFRDTGSEEANYTMHMNKLFTRLSITNGQPSSSTAKIKVKRDDKEFVVELPWITKDLVDYKAEQAAATASDKKSQTAKSGLSIQDSAGNTLFSLAALGFDGRIFDPTTIEAKIKKGSSAFRFSNGFKFLDNFAEWIGIAADGSIKTDDSEPKTPKEILKAQRSVPSTAVFVDAAKTYPAYVNREKHGSDTKLVGYIYLDTFSPDGDEGDVLKEFKATLSEFQTLGVKDIVIDMINNGGGSLNLGMQLAQALSPEKVVMPDMQYRLSDTWIDEFDTESRTGASDTNRELARRIVSEMKADQAAGQRLSRKYSGETLAPYAIELNDDLDAKFNVVLLVNEMCASMCDIYSGILKDNGMAKIVGANTMGAGGNVVSIDQAPNSHLTLRQTESLIVRKDGSYIENNGVAPDVAVDVSDASDGKYSSVRKKAIDLIFTSTQ